MRDDSTFSSITTPQAEYFEVDVPELTSSFLIGFNDDSWFFNDEFAVKGCKIIDEVIIWLIFLLLLLESSM